jgi:riboflavin synthase alpha subunit
MARGIKTSRVISSRIMTGHIMTGHIMTWAAVAWIAVWLTPYLYAVNDLITWR